MAERITSRKNEKVMHLKKLGASAGYRRESGEFLCDGDKLFFEALKNGADIRMAFLCEDTAVEVPAGIPAYRVSRDILDAVSPQKTPQNVVFSCAIPKDEEHLFKGKHILLENIQDPGNVGTIIRTANAFRMDSVYLVGDCADLYSPKTVRATMGALFRQKVCRIDYGGVQALKETGLRLYGAALSENSTDIRRVDFADAAFVIGSEGRGLSEKMLRLCDEQVIIPMNPACESLNAASAASVILWEMRKDDL